MINTKLILPVILAFCLRQFKSFAQHKNDTIHDDFSEQIEVQPRFPGGSAALYRFIQARLHKIDGTKNKKVFVSFLVRKDGKLSDFKIMRGLNKQADSEVLRVIKLLPKWKPAVQNGRACEVTYMLPIVFSK